MANTTEQLASTLVAMKFSNGELILIALMSVPSFSLHVHCVGISVFHLGAPQTLVGIGADAAPAGQRLGPILSPWADCNSFTSEPDFGEDSSCNHSLDATS